MSGLGGVKFESDALHEDGHLNAQSPIGQRPNRPHWAGASHQPLGSGAVLDVEV